MNLDKNLFHEVSQTRGLLVLAVGAGLLAGLLLVAQAYLLSQAISHVFLGHATLSDIAPLLGACGAVVLGRALLLGGAELAGHTLADRVKAALRERLLAHLVALGPAYARGERSGELAHTATEGIEALHAYVSEYLPQLALAVLVPLAMLAVVFPLDLLSGIVLLLTAPMIPLLMILIGKAANWQSRRQWTQLSRMSAHFLDVLQGLPTLKIFGRSREQAATIAAVSEQFRDATMSVLRVAFLSAFVLEMLATISTALIAVEIGLRLLYGRLAFDEALFILMLAPEYYLPLRQLGARFHAGVSGITAAARIFAVLQTPPADCAPTSVVRLSERVQKPLTPAPLSLTEARGNPALCAPSPPGGRGMGGSLPYTLSDLPVPPFEVHFEDVHYAYDEGDRPALNGLTLSIPARQTVALVGPSGAGKSTVAHLLLRFIAPTAGRITVNRCDLCDLLPDTWRAQIAWVPQLPYLFDATIADNIRLGRPDAPLDAVIHAAQQAGADEFIRALPHGYNTRIGERGARLSGGQAQRLALARAFLRDAPLVILDEATANLDPTTETSILAAMAALRQGRTVLVIAHRLRTIRDADQIAVLVGGRVVEYGSHALLSARPGFYRRLLTAVEGGL
ncbi:MAG: thiol reductant ABC exporter subunit CydD [Aggregatilineaceae bacterium]